MNTRLVGRVDGMEPQFTAARGARFSRIVLIGLSLLSTPLMAQGSMGGGMGGGDMGGGMGARGGPPGGGKSPVEMIKENLDNTNPMKFLLDHKKPLTLTSAQQDTMKRYRKEMEDMQKPVFKDLETMFGQGPSRGSGMGAEQGGRAMGGGMSSGMGSGMSGQAPSGGRAGSGEAENDGAPSRRLPEPAKKLVDKLADIQDSYRDRARAQLTEPQRVQADSIEVVWLAKQRSASKRE